MRRRRLFTALSVLSLVACLATAAVWVHGRSRVAGWYFRPSREFTISPPDPSQPADWFVQWQVFWGRDGRLDVFRQVRPATGRMGGPIRVGFFSVGMPSPRWNPLPEPLPSFNPNIAAVALRQTSTGYVQTSVRRRNPATLVRFLGVEYSAHEQEFGQYPSGEFFSGFGSNGLRIPLLYLFIIFAIAPTLSLLRWLRRRHLREGCCPACDYNLTGNTSGVCPECGTPTTAGVRA